MAGKPYQGHPSYAQWNVSLWFANDEGLYHMALAAKSPMALWRECEEIGFTKTPDGVKLSKTTVSRAWKDVRE